MRLPGLEPFAEVWAVDFEFHQRDGETPEPICMVGREVRSGRTIQLWREELVVRSASPIPATADQLFVAYYASAEIGCYLELGWPVPVRILDLCAEFRRMTCGLAVPCGRGLVGAMAYFGLSSVDTAEKETMRELAMRGGPYTSSERDALLDYCTSDVDALARLLPLMLPNVDLPRALLRGRYMAAAARIERTGTPIDVATLDRLRDGWSSIKSALIEDIDRDFGVYENGSFRAERFARYLGAAGVPWPRLDSGNLALDDETFKAMAARYPQLQPLRELRRTLGKLRVHDLAVGRDGRNRCLLSAFASKTGRNQPSTSRFIFGLPSWLRSLIKPGRGKALAYVDYEQQEFGIAAALSQDEAMMCAYTSGDPYLAFAKQAGAVPDSATRQSHPDLRERFKTCALAVQYGMGERSLAMRLGCSTPEARDLLRAHRRTYPRLWRWLERVVDYAMLTGSLDTVFGWRLHVAAETSPRSVMNFPMQANGAEMLRLACCTLTEGGVAVCAPVHDAVLLEAGVGDIDDAVARCRAEMADSARLVLGGFAIRTDVKVIRDPERFIDGRGERMWEAAREILQRLGGDGDVSRRDPPRVCRDGAATCVGAGHPLHLLSPSSLWNR